MAKNQYKDPRRDTPNQGEGGSSDATSVIALFNKLLRIDSVFENGLPIRYIPRLLWVTGLCTVYIGLNHFANRTTVRLAKTQAETEELRENYITMKAEYMYASKQSEVAVRVQNLGLAESVVPPRKLTLRPRAED